MVTLSNTFLKVLKSKHGEDEFVQHTVAYGVGAFGYHIPKDDFSHILPRALELIKPVAYAEDAFDEDNLEKTENYLGALMKLSYKHIDESTLTKEDMSYVLAHMPFTSDECESKVSHRILINEIRNQNPHLVSTDMQPKAINALKAIKKHVTE